MLFRSGCIKLPGDKAPEVMVFEDLKEAGWPNLNERFGVGAGQLFTYLEDAMREPEHHRWSALVGDRILQSSTNVWRVLANQWCRSCLSDEERNHIVERVQQFLD